ncbi:hypothetical protein NLI96_g9047 [Meripilus lineatus]|uniref:NmrA-like domain-containing protein n=1 Tax=Meripilus lineatus TaxID=2056292 RepID=A0AAD5UXU2_9APHY|nr:hypothetical protein NLI96_g9047 [Physisporinus lineatus]
MPITKTPILLLGATGYIGGSVLYRLLSHPKANTFDITVFVRDARKAGVAESQFGVNAVIGSLADENKLEALAEKAHVVFSCADADNLKSINAILRGLSKRHATTGDTPIFIHTSGTGVLMDNAKGMYPTETIYDDSNIAQIESISETQPHRDVDLTIIEADKQGFLKSYIILPSTIYGRPENPLVDAGFQKNISVQIPAIIRASIDRGQGGMVGKGLSMWPSVHIDEVENPEKVGHGREGFYFAESGEHRWYDISKEVSRVLVELGRGKSDEPTAFTREELPKYFLSEDIGNSLGSNSRCRATRARSLGWHPKKTTKDMLASIKPEIEAILESMGQK